MASGPKYWDKVETNKLCLGDRDVIGHKLVDWEMFSGDKHVCLPAEQSDSSAAASNCVFPGGKSAFLACCHRTDVQWWRPEGWWGGVCQTSASGVIIKITPVVIAHMAKKETTHNWSRPLFWSTRWALSTWKCRKLSESWKCPSRREKKQNTASQRRYNLKPAHRYSAHRSPYRLLCCPFFFFFFDGFICYSDMQNIRLIWPMEVDHVVHPDPLTHIRSPVLEVLTSTLGSFF